MEEESKAREGSTAGELPSASADISVPIVGMGASAGWFEAVTEFLGHLPADTGFAFVLVVHLDPKHESQMAGLLERHTNMPVVQGTDGMPIEPNHLYTVPPNAYITVKRGLIRIAARESAPGHGHVVDRFFRSLAEDRGPGALGVVLSGTLSDGVVGLREIKDAGGVTFAQSLESARYRDMPRNAIHAGAVDFVLPPAEIAAELGRLRHNLASPASSPTVASIEEQNIQSILRTLRSRTGVDFGQYKRTTVLRRIHRRMLATRRPTFAEYATYIDESSEEAGLLHEELLIHVTRFFRDPESFVTLAEKILPDLVEGRRRDQPLRVWVPGCATGEEAYSIVVVIMEFLQARGLSLPVQLFATDLSERVIASAREGVYPDTIAEDVSPERLLHFFEKTDRGYQVNKMVRGSCVFAVHDITSDPPFSNMDIISCRNVLVYMDVPLQRTVLATLHYALKPNGSLLLGAAEAVGRSEDIFSPVDKDRSIYGRRNVVPTVLPPFLRTDRLGPVSHGAAHPPLGWNDVSVQREADRILLDRFAPPAVVVTAADEIVQFHGRTSPYLEHRAGDASLNLLRLANEALGMELRVLLQKAKATNQPQEKANVEFRVDGEARSVRIEVVPILGPTRSDRYFLIVFHSGRGTEKAKIPPRSAPLFRFGFSKSEVRRLADRVLQLEQELNATRDHLRLVVEDYEATTEELRSANEEAVSSNEELQSTNEELETTKEELQSTNEELTTLNEELKHRSLDIQKVNNDLLNLLNSVSLPIVMLGPDLRIRRFTPMAQAMLKLIATDVGRPLTDISQPFDVDELRKDILAVLSDLKIREFRFRGPDGAEQVVNIRPYRTSDNRIEGAVLIVFPTERTGGSP